MKVAGKKSTAKNTNENRGESPVDLEEQISRRAYELYERRAREDGHDTEDWLQAEAELTREKNKPVANEAVKTNRKPAVTTAGKTKAKQAKKIATVAAD